MGEILDLRIHTVIDKSHTTAVETSRDTVAYDEEEDEGRRKRRVNLHDLLHLLEPPREGINSDECPQYLTKN